MHYVVNRKTIQLLISLDSFLLFCYINKKLYRKYDVLECIILIFNISHTVCVINRKKKGIESSLISIK